MKFQLKPFLSKRVIILTVCMLMAAIAGQFSRFHWTLDLATHLTWHYILLGMTFGVILFWLNRPRWALLAIVTALLNNPLVIDYFRFNPADASANTAKEELLILQFNIGSKNTDVQKFAEWMNAQPDPPHIVVVIEASQKLKPVIEQLKATGWQHTLADYQEDNYGIAVLSRLKDSTLVLEPVGDPFLPSIAVRGHTDNQHIPFTILATHPPPPITGALSRARDKQYVAYAQWVQNESIPKTSLNMVRSWS